VKAWLPCLIAVGALLRNGTVLGEPWSTQPLIGVVGQYASNPALAASPQSETNGALLLDAPVNYDSDDLHFVATPNIRYGNASGYSSLTSNYFHLDSSLQLSNELGLTGVNAAVYRDSSLLYAGELTNGVGVRRDTSSFGADWQRLLTERLQLQLAANTSRTLYAQGSSPDESRPSNAEGILSTLVDYRYTTVSPGLTLAQSELNTLHLVGAFGRYEALDGISSSDNANLQLGFDRSLNELWTLKTTAGYSRAENRYNFFFGPYLLAQIDSTQNGTVFSANLARQSEVLGLNLGVSRALAPTGFAYLARQQSVSLQANYTRSERWSYGINASFQKNDYPGTSTGTGAAGGSYQQRFYYAALSGTWHATEQWALTVQATKILQQYGTPLVTGASSGVSVQISKQLYRKDL
jgi:hypothetical protein